MSLPFPQPLRKWALGLRFLEVKVQIGVLGNPQCGWVICLWLASFSLLTHKPFFGHPPWLQAKVWEFSPTSQLPGNSSWDTMRAGAGWATAAGVNQLHFFYAPPRWGSRDGRLLKSRSPASGQLALSSLCASREPQLHRVLWTPLHPCACGFCCCSWWALLVVWLQHPPKVSSQDPSYPGSPAAQGPALARLSPGPCLRPGEVVHS